MFQAFQYRQQQAALRFVNMFPSHETAWRHNENNMLKQQIFNLSRQLVSKDQEISELKRHLSDSERKLVVKVTECAIAQQGRDNLLKWTEKASLALQGAKVAEDTWEEQKTELEWKLAEKESECAELIRQSAASSWNAPKISRSTHVQTDFSDAASTAASERLALEEAEEANLRLAAEGNQLKANLKEVMAELVKSRQQLYGARKRPSPSYPTAWQDPKRKRTSVEGEEEESKEMLLQKVVEALREARAEFALLNAGEARTHIPSSANLDVRDFTAQHAEKHSE